MHRQPVGDVNEAPSEQSRSRKQQPGRHGLGSAAQVLADGFHTAAEKTCKFLQVKQTIAVGLWIGEMCFLSQVRSF